MAKEEKTKKEETPENKDENYDKDLDLFRDENGNLTGDYIDELEDWQEEILDRLWANVDNLPDFTTEDIERIENDTNREKLIN